MAIFVSKVPALAALFALCTGMSTRAALAVPATTTATPLSTPTPSKTSAPSATSAPAAEVLLKDADRARGGLSKGVTWNVDLTTVEDKEETRRSYLVKAEGDDALVETLSPPKNKGEVMLFNDRTIWFVKPGLKKPVSISARQRLSGQAANGDIATTNYARDYDGKVTGEEKVGGVPCYVLDLKAKAKNVTYDKIRYWVSKDKRLGLKAEFQSLEGKPFKTAEFEYGSKVKVDGKDIDFVSRMSIRDAALKDNVTTIDYKDARPGALPRSLFNINNVLR